MRVWFAMWDLVLIHRNTWQQWEPGRPRPSILPLTNAGAYTQRQNGFGNENGFISNLIMPVFVGAISACRLALMDTDDAPTDIPLGDIPGLLAPPRGSYVSINCIYLRV